LIPLWYTGCADEADSTLHRSNLKPHGDHAAVNFEQH